MVELSLQHILPHFRECWWDHVFLDVLFSNTIAIEIGKNKQFIFFFFFTLRGSIFFLNKLTYIVAC